MSGQFRQIFMVILNKTMEKNRLEFPYVFGEPAACGFTWEEEDKMADFSPERQARVCYNHISFLGKYRLIMEVSGSMWCSNSQRR